MSRMSSVERDRITEAFRKESEALATSAIIFRDLADDYEERAAAARHRYEEALRASD